jgi:Pvc16 N-terminal domain
MSEYSVIYDITNTILNLLKTNTGGLLQQDHISAASPADTTNDTPPSLSLFLYQVTENRGLKNQRMQETSTGTLRYPPLCLNLHYLLTAYASSRETEHQIAGRAMQILHDNAVVRGSLLQGSLSGTFEEIVVLMNPIPLDDMNRLWSMFGSKPYRLSIPYQVSTALIDSSRERSGDRVIERTLSHSVP